MAAGSATSSPGPCTEHDIPGARAIVLAGVGADTMAAMKPVPALPRRIAGIAVPQDDVSAETWRWAHRSLPDYLLTHSVRSYAWGATIAAGEGWSFDRRVLWTASLTHDVGPHPDPAERDVLRGRGRRDRPAVPRAARDAGDRGRSGRRRRRAPHAAVGHARRRRGIGAARPGDVARRPWRGLRARRRRPLGRDATPSHERDFDRRFLAAISREAALRPTCQSARLLHRTGLADWMARSSWAANAGRWRRR